MHLVVEPIILSAQKRLLCMSSWPAGSGRGSASGLAHKTKNPLPFAGSGFPALKKLKTLARLLVAHKRTRR